MRLSIRFVVFVVFQVRGDVFKKVEIGRGVVRVFSLFCCFGGKMDIIFQESWLVEIGNENFLYVGIERDRFRVIQQAVEERVEFQFFDIFIVLFIFQVRMFQLNVFVVRIQFVLYVSKICITSIGIICLFVSCVVFVIRVSGVCLGWVGIF